MSVLTLTIPMRLESSANVREHWSDHYSRDREQRSTVYAHLLRVLGRRERIIPASVTLCRIGGRLLDSDNNISAFKGIRDVIARAFGVDDGPKGPITWHYEQRLGAYAIEIRMEMT
jgi:hypothetical protein